MHSRSALLLPGMLYAEHVLPMQQSMICLLAHNSVFFLEISFHICIFTNSLDKNSSDVWPL